MCNCDKICIDNKHFYTGTVCLPILPFPDITITIMLTFVMQGVMQDRLSIHAGPEGQLNILCWPRGPAATHALCIWASDVILTKVFGILTEKMLNVILLEGHLNI